MNSLRFKNYELLIFIFTSLFLFYLSYKHVYANPIFKNDEQFPRQLPENSYAKGEVIVKLKSGTTLRSATRFEQTVFNKPKIISNKQEINIVSRQASFQNLKSVGKSEQGIYKIGTRQENVEKIVEQLNATEDVLYAEPNYLVYSTAIPNDPYFQYQWNFDAIKADKAWDLLSNNHSVKVAVLDSGLAYENYTDPNPAKCINNTGTDYYDCVSAGTNYAAADDLPLSRVLPGYDFINRDSHPNDDQGHGTHVAAIIFQTTNNNNHAAGLTSSSKIKIMPLKILSANGSVFMTEVAEAIDYAVDHGVDVINMSIASSQESNLLRDAIHRAKYDHGVVIVVSSGNEDSSVSFPARMSQVIAVGAVRQDNQRADYSNKGSELDIVAPGGQYVANREVLDQNNDKLPDGIVQQTIDPGNYANADFDPTQITSIKPGSNPWDFKCLDCNLFECWINTRCGLYQGTSMASPHVSAAAALMLSEDNSLTNDQIKWVLQNTAIDLGPAGKDNDYGYGLLNIEAAINLIIDENSDPCSDYDYDTNSSVNVNDLLHVLDNWGLEYGVNELLAVLDCWGWQE